MNGKLIIKGHDKNIFVKFWNWGWGIYYKNPEIWNYLIVGLLTTVVSLVTYFVVTRTFLDPNEKLELQIANIIAWVFAVMFAYVTNRIFVFKSKNKNIVSELSKFVGSRIASLLMDMSIMFVIVSLLSLSDIIGKIASQIVVTIANYILSKLIVFKKK
ncbi:MAG: GtrA family protein [Erysipelotrichales bacterium]|nr:GtrA family protein [Erysipelotrichales bacterium]